MNMGYKIAFAYHATLLRHSEARPWNHLSQPLTYELRKNKSNGLVDHRQAQQ